MSTDDQPTPLELAAAGQTDPGNPFASPEGAWLDAFLDLKAAGLNWKRAAFAAWVNAPKATRQPGTMKELATLLNLKSEQIFYRWRNEPWFREMGIDHLRQSIFQKHIASVDRQTITQAITETGSPGVAARRLFYEQAKLATPVEVDLPVDSNFERALLAAYGGRGPEARDQERENDNQDSE